MHEVSTYSKKKISAIQYGIVLGISIIACVLAAYIYIRPRSQGNVERNVTMRVTDNGFIPSELRVVKGTTVRFVNDSEVARWPASDPHPIHTNYPELDPKKPIAPHGQWSITLSKVGQWGIHDHLEPYLTATIIVTP